MRSMSNGKHQTDTGGDQFIVNAIVKGSHSTRPCSSFQSFHVALFLAIVAPFSSLGLILGRPTGH